MKPYANGNNQYFNELSSIFYALEGLQIIRIYGYNAMEGLHCEKD